MKFNSKTKEIKLESPISLYELSELSRIFNLDLWRIEGEVILDNDKSKKSFDEDVIEETEVKNLKTTNESIISDNPFLLKKEEVRVVNPIKHYHNHKISEETYSLTDIYSNFQLFYKLNPQYNVDLNFYTNNVNDKIQWIVYRTDHFNHYQRFRNLLKYDNYKSDSIDAQNLYYNLINLYSKY